MLCCKGAGSGNALDISEQQASGCQRHNPFYILQPQRRAVQGGQAGRDLPRRWHPEGGKAQHGGNDDRERDDTEGNRPSRKLAFSQRQQHDRDDADR